MSPPISSLQNKRGKKRKNEPRYNVTQRLHDFRNRNFLIRKQHFHLQHLFGFAPGVPGLFSCCLHYYSAERKAEWLVKKLSLTCTNNKYSIRLVQFFDDYQQLFLMLMSQVFILLPFTLFSIKWIISLSLIYTQWFHNAQFFLIFCSQDPVCDAVIFKLIPLLFIFPGRAPKIRFC